MRRDSDTNWSAQNPILQDGEIGYDKTSKRQKVGDGSTTWNELVWLKTDYNDLLNAPALTAFDGAYANLTGKPELFDGAYANLTGKPELFDGNYLNLTNAPDLTLIVIDGGGAAG
ncbi:hypothetical protein [Methylotenera sp.]|uniref:hyaluronate lyase N-terminal domain-containing protein n=1 Tax=Methylotenera sp. TaxID=2051956 RepID=UPI0027321ADD|nr:hypothetical protein [Methylotenera sp.]MDP2071563.1 hypothetical protein [Methylotenera sp.]MDP3006654.1 hypothetical protein [Methylotenera sp.]